MHSLSPINPPEFSLNQDRARSSDAAVTDDKYISNPADCAAKVKIEIIYQQNISYFLCSVFFLFFLFFSFDWGIREFKDFFDVGTDRKIINGK